MYIQEVTIEGFKSYAQRVVLPNFDPTFNAITGLNGTGKSNILDSICFVMGIKNLAQVRCASLQELVYKQGQAGITKASVSITFHNNDPKTGPTGYEDKEYITITRQIVIGGRNKYLINGHAAQENRVQDLFHSVQLNVNNPHFLIMQGRINKVCGMKPIEIMSLLEEASGTRMYEKKKEKAMQTMEKKDQKLKEIEAVLNEEIQPAVEKLKKQCSEYHEWAELSSSRERLKRFLVAYDYSECLRLTHSMQVEMEDMETSVKLKIEEKGKLASDAADRESQIRDLETEKEIKEGGEMKELQAKADQLNMKLTTSTTALKNKKENLNAERSALSQIEASSKELSEQDPQGKVVKATVARDEAKAAVVSFEGAVEAATREVAGVEAGDGRDESNKSLQERLSDAQVAQTEADAEAQKCEIRSKGLSKQLIEMSKSLSLKGKEATQLQKDLEKHEEVVKECEAALQGLKYNPSEMTQLEEEKESLTSQLRKAKEEVERLGHQVSSCAFNYSDPRANFDRSKVRGVVAKLIRVRDPSTSTALEVAAGGKLYQVVVDDEGTAKELLEKGKLSKRVTIIPLNKVQYSSLSPATRDAAHKLGGDKVQPAIELVGYEEDVSAAVKYAFGSSLVCQDSGTAKKLAFAREVNQRCVTLQGDDFNPSGLLTGGSRPSGGGVLTNLHELSEAESKLRSLSSQLSEVEKRILTLSSAAREHKKLLQQLELKSHALNLLKVRVEGSESAQLAVAVDQLKKQVLEAEEQAEAAKTKKQELISTAKSLEREIRDFSQERGKRLKSAQDKLKKGKSDLEGAKKTLKAKEQALQESIAEAEAAGHESEALKVKATSVKATIAALESEVADLEAQASAAKKEAAVATKDLNERRERLRECDVEIRGLEKERDRMMRGVTEIDAEIKKIETRAKHKNEEKTKYLSHMSKLEEQYKWVLTEKESFGRPSSDYDFKKNDPKRVHAQYEEAEKRLEELKGKVNHQCMAKLEKAESECKGLMDKWTIVENDKKSLKQVIEELDEKKKAALKATWLKVNGDFGAIFSTLLPGTRAKLEPPEGTSFLDGLEMRVAFGEVWKESLTELSGGQRSLLALSLILALCRFKPAPLYILDEVDSALDLNNSQNIGRMIKQHFPQSQFLVVSHKDGFFNNANIIFRTKFVDGVSAVTRTVVQHADRVASGAVTSSQHENISAGSKASARAAAGSGRQALKESNRI